MESGEGAPPRRAPSPLAFLLHGLEMANGEPRENSGSVRSTSFLDGGDILLFGEVVTGEAPDLGRAGTGAPPDARDDLLVDMSGEEHNLPLGDKEEKLETSAAAQTSQEHRPFCSAGPNCTVLEAEHYVTHRHTALNKTEKEMEDAKLQDVSRDKKERPAGRWMDFLSRKKSFSEIKKEEKGGIEAGGESRGSLRDSTAAATTTTSSGSPPATTGFGLMKIFGKKAESSSDDGSTPSSPSQSSTFFSPILSQAPQRASEPLSNSLSTVSFEPQDSNTDGNQPLQEQSRTEWAAQKRAALVGRIKEIKKMLQETNVSGVGLIAFKKLAEELEVFEKELEDILAMGDSFYIWQSQKRRLIEITPQGQVAICDLIYQSAVVNEWGPLMQQVNFKGSILSSGPSYTHCKVGLVTQDGRQISNPQDACRLGELLFEVKLASSLRYVHEIRSFGVVEKPLQRKGSLESTPSGTSFRLEWKNGAKEQWYVEDREGFERVMTYHVRAYGLRRAKQVGRLRGLWCLACTPYNSTDKQNESDHPVNGALEHRLSSDTAHRKSVSSVEATGLPGQ